MRDISKFEMPGTEYLKRYIHHQYRLNLKPATIKKAIGSGKQFLTFLNKIDKCKLEELSREELEAFIEHEQDRGLSPRSVYTMLATIRAFLNYLIQKGVVDREVLARSIRVPLAMIGIPLVVLSIFLPIGVGGYGGPQLIAWFLFADFGADAFPWATNYNDLSNLSLR